MPKHTVPASVSLASPTMTHTTLNSWLLRAHLDLSEIGTLVRVSMQTLETHVASLAGAVSLSLSLSLSRGRY